MTSPLRAGVIGAGVFGGYHAAKWAGFDGVSLTSVYDVHAERAQALADRHGAAATVDAASFFEAVDVVSVASPAHTHAGWAIAALKAGKPVYVEKPLATDLTDGDHLVQESAARGLVLACGFLERAAFQAIGLLRAPEAPIFLQAVRAGAASPRNLDVSVVLDLMIHDLDLALAIGRGQPFAVEGQGDRTIHELIDRAEAEVIFDDGFTARFRASRVAAAPERTMRIVYPSGEVRIDFLNGLFENTTAFPLDGGFAATPAGQDRLGASLMEFLRTVRGEAARPLADAQDGLRALDLALAVEQAVDG